MLANKTYGKISINGPDAATFLQGQLTCDVNTQSMGAYCNAKGRIIAIMHVNKHSDDLFELVLPTDLIPITIAELRKYGMFSKITIEHIEDYSSPVDILELINTKTPMVFAGSSGLFLPHNINLPKLNMVSFTKGCYRGQEIIARMEYLGNIKKYLEKAIIPKSEFTTLPLPGDKLYNRGNKQIGIIILATESNNSEYALLAELGLH